MNDRTVPLGQSTGATSSRIEGATISASWNFALCSGVMAPAPRATRDAGVQLDATTRRR